MTGNIRRSLWLLGLLALLLLSGCSGGNGVVETNDGLAYYPVKGMGGFDFLEYWNGEDAYACNIEKFTGTSLTVPSTFQNKPVIAVWGDNTNITDLRIGEGVLAVEKSALRSLQTAVIPASVVCLNEAFRSAQLTEVTFSGNVSRISWLSFSNCGSLEKVTFLGDVGTISSCFRDCPKLKEVVFNGKVRELSGSAFSSCPALKSVTLPAETVVGDEVFRRPEKYDAAYLPEDTSEYCRRYDIGKLEAAALGSLGSALDPEKEIAPADAVHYKDRFNGPVLYTDQCPDCEYTDYSPEFLPDDLVIRTADVGEIEYFHSGTVYTKEKAESVRNGSSPVICCLCETCGYSKGPDYTLSSNNYYLWYRISLWDTETNTLVAWYTERNGYAPGSYTIGVGGKDPFFPIVFSGKVRNFFLNEDGSEPDPVRSVLNDFFGGSGQGAGTEIIRRPAAAPGE